MSLSLLFIKKMSKNFEDRTHIQVNNQYSVHFFFKLTLDIVVVLLSCLDTGECLVDTFYT